MPLFPQYLERVQEIDVVLMRPELRRIKKKITLDAKFIFDVAFDAGGFFAGEPPGAGNGMTTTLGALTE